MTQFERALIDQLKGIKKELHEFNRKNKCSGSCKEGMDEEMDSEMDK